MTKQRVVFLTHYFPPEVCSPSIRTFEQCKCWLSRREVTVITNFPNHPGGKLYPGYRKKFVFKEEVDGIHVLRLWTLPAPEGRPFLKFLSFLVYMLLSSLFVISHRKDYDLLIAETPQFFCGISGLIIKKFTRLPFILDLGDLWPESAAACGTINGKMLLKMLGSLEDRLYTAADRILPSTRSFKDKLISKGVSPAKIEVLLSSVAIEKFSYREDIINEDLRCYLKSGFNVGYAGSIGRAESLMVLVDAASILKYTDVKFMVIGDGCQKGEMVREIRRRNLTNIRVFPFQTQGQILSIMEKFDLVCVHLKAEEFFKSVIPLKLLEGMAMKKPILMGIQGEAGEIVKKAGCGLPFIPEDPLDLASKVLDLRNSPADVLFKGLRGYEYVAANFDINRKAEQFLNLQDRLLETGRFQCGSLEPKGPIHLGLGRKTKQKEG